MPELLFMLKGILAAARSVGFTFVMMFGVLFICGISCRQLSDGMGIGMKYFPSVLESMYSLFFYGALLDSAGTMMTDLLEESWLCGFIFAIVILLGALTMMNMLVGVLCEVMSSVAQKEKEKMATAFLRSKVEAIMSDMGLDVNRNGLISVEEFEGLLANEQAANALRDIDVDPEVLIDMTDGIFQADSEGQRFDKELDMDSFMALVMQVRGGNTATVRDLLQLRHFIQDEFTEKTLTLTRLEQRLKNAMAERSRIEDRLTQHFNLLYTKVSDLPLS
jgi:hypothetical protein